MPHHHTHPPAPTWDNEQKNRHKPGVRSTPVPADPVTLERAITQPGHSRKNAVLALQQVAGNRATTGLIQRGRMGGSIGLPGAVGSLVPLQDAQKEELILTPRAPGNQEDLVQRQEEDDIYEDSPFKMRKVTGGSLEGGKKVSDYYPDLIGKNIWGSDTSAGPFDNGVRAGSVVQLIAELPEGATPANYTLQQSIAIDRFRKDGEILPEEGVTLDDVARSGRDQSQAPFRQVWDNKVSMCDPISGLPYSDMQDYDFAASATTSIVHTDGESASVEWSVRIKSEDGNVIENTVS